MKVSKAQSAMITFDNIDTDFRGREHDEACLCSILAEWDANLQSSSRLLAAPDCATWEREMATSGVGV